MARCGAQEYLRILQNYETQEMPIDALNVTRYPRDPGPYITEPLTQPSWDIVERELRSMHNREKPILWLHQDREVGDRDCMTVCGGCGVYHVQIVDEKGDWQQAFDPNGSNEDVEVWLSDQGFTTAAKFTWPVEQAVELVRWYFDRGTPHGAGASELELLRTVAQGLGVRWGRDDLGWWATVARQE